MAQTTFSTDKAKAGIFQYLLKIDGTPEQVRQAQAQLAQLTPQTKAVYEVLNLLPEGELKSWLMANPVQFWKKVIGVIKGRKYTRGDYTLAERYNDQILCNGDASQGEMPDDSVPVAWRVFTTLFGVLIRTDQDLEALDDGVQQYMNRHPQSDLEAVKRAVYLKQKYYPEAYNNVQCWDLKYFEQHPLVAPIPDPEIDDGKVHYYNGPLPGGAIAVNGLIPVSADTILKQYVGATIDENTGEYDNLPIVARIKQNIIPIIVVCLALVLLIILYVKRYKK